MPPITWKNVNAPNSGAILESMRKIRAGIGESFNQFGGAITSGVEDFSAGRTSDAIADLQTLTDPSERAAAIQQARGSFINTDELIKANTSLGDRERDTAKDAAQQTLLDQSIDRGQYTQGRRGLLEERESTKLEQAAALHEGRLTTQGLQDQVIEGRLEEGAYSKGHRDLLEERKKSLFNASILAKEDIHKANVAKQDTRKLENTLLESLQADQSTQTGASTTTVPTAIKPNRSSKEFADGKVPSVDLALPTAPIRPPPTGNAIVDRVNTFKFKQQTDALPEQIINTISQAIQHPDYKFGTTSQGGRFTPNESGVGALVGMLDSAKQHYAGTGVKFSEIGKRLENTLGFNFMKTKMNTKRSFIKSREEDINKAYTDQGKFRVRERAKYGINTVLDKFVRGDGEGDTVKAFKIKDFIKDVKAKLPKTSLAKGQDWLIHKGLLEMGRVNYDWPSRNEIEFEGDAVTYIEQLAKGYQDSAVIIPGGFGKKREIIGIFNKRPKPAPTK